MFPFWFGLLFSCDSEKSATQQNDGDNQVVANDPATQDSASDEVVESDDSASTNTETEDDSGEPVVSCDDQLEPALTWFDNENITQYFDNHRKTKPSGPPCCQRHHSMT